MKQKKISGGPRPQQAPHSLPWTALEQQVVRLQKQIAHASQRGDLLAVHAFQHHLLESEAARLLAVHRVASKNQGKDTAGVDGVKSLTAKEQLNMAARIHPRHWKTQPSLPVRRVWIPKSGTQEQRPLAILPMIDRCKQALVKLALEPEWEVRFESQSYGFRPGRSVHDAITALLVALNRQPMFVFNADIEAAFDHVKQTVILDRLQTYPALRRQIATWFTAGIMDAGTYSSSEVGIAQGGVLSPLLLNIALHGMGAIVAQGTGNHRQTEQPLLVRYADNFILAHPDLNTLQHSVRRVKDWLADMGFQLHPDKTAMTHTLIPAQGRVGFDFLGFSFHQEADEKILRWQQRHTKGAVRSSSPFPPSSQTHPLPIKTIVSPSQEASMRHLTSLDQRLQRLQNGTQEQVIAQLNPLILGWSSYYTGLVSAEIMQHYDDLLTQRLLQWASHRHPGKTQDWLFAHYWHQVGAKRDIFATSDGKQLRPYQHSSLLDGLSVEREARQ